MTEIGFIGLGRMGMNMVNRMLDSKRIRVITWNRSQDKVAQTVERGAIGCATISQLVTKLQCSPKVVWLMLPSGDVTEQAFQEVLSLLSSGDIIVDGANSNFHDTIRRHETAKQKGVRMLDVGVSGGIVAAHTGYPMMIGGEADTYEHVKPIFETFGITNGYDLVGPGGAGHYVKMIHNAVEYGMMQAIAEGFDLMKNGRYDSLDLANISRVWNNGCIVESFLMRMVQQAFEKRGTGLAELQAWVDDSGEGEWSAIEAMQQKVPFVCNAYAVHTRRLSQNRGEYSYKLLSAIRNEFGGHAVK